MPTNAMEIKLDLGTVTNTFIESRIDRLLIQRAKILRHALRKKALSDNHVFMKGKSLTAM